MALRYVGAPVQPGDLIYLKAWKNYVPGYVGWAEEHEGGIVSVISSAMGGGVFTSKETHKKLANWVPESKKATAAVVFKVNKDGDKVYLQADNVDGHSLGGYELCHTGGRVIYDAPQDLRVAHMKFPGDDSVAFEMNNKPLRAEKWGDHWFFVSENQSAQGCHFMAEKA